MDLPLVFVELLIIVAYLLRYRLFHKKTYILFDRIKFTFSPAWKMVFIPVMALFVTWFFWKMYMLYLFQVFTPFQINLDFIIEYVILAPIAEGILLALILSMLFLIINKTFTDRWLITGCYAVSIIVLSFVIAILHKPPYEMSLFVRFVTFNLYSMIYYYTEENLPSIIIPHATWNSLLML